MSERMSVVLEESPGLSRMMREVELRRALGAKSDQEVAELIELSLEEFRMESEVIVAVLETASYRLHRAGAGATAITEPHPFDPHVRQPDVCWLCGDERDAHPSKEAEGGAGAETSSPLACEVTSRETPSACDVRAALSQEEWQDALVRCKRTAARRGAEAAGLKEAAELRERFGKDAAGWWSDWKQADLDARLYGALALLIERGM